MAYPFAPVITFADLKERLTKLGCKHNQLANAFVDDQGNTQTIWYFERAEGGKVHRAACQSFNDTDLLTFSVLRSICARLGIDPRKLDVGLDLG